MSENKITTTIRSYTSQARAHISDDNDVSLHGWDGDHMVDISDGTQVTALMVLEDMRSIINDAIAELECRT